MSTATKSIKQVPTRLVSIEIYSGIARFPCYSMAFLCLSIASLIPALKHLGSSDAVIATVFRIRITYLLYAMRHTVINISDQRETLQRSSSWTACWAQTV